MVSTLQPFACTASIRQPRTISPLTLTVHAPHTPCSQPICEPVRPSSSRRKSTSAAAAQYGGSPARRSRSWSYLERVPRALEQDLGEMELGGGRVVEIRRRIKILAEGLLRLRERF